MRVLNPLNVRGARSLQMVCAGNEVLRAEMNMGWSLAVEAQDFAFFDVNSLSERMTKVVGCF
ncbi:hypothetical protein IV01_02140 [Pseudomonas syringae]|uniref:Uncharacterized protein n=1 Tax=Pseudomonas syringae TaxID=317 RepID=A0A085VQB7_PSESX|nr:hypothetical protein IV01_02140 [Pseudomonas syringae]